MTPGANDARFVAASHLAMYLDNDSGAVLFAHAEPYADIAAACEIACRRRGIDFISRPAEQGSLSELTSTLAAHPAVCLAFNRTYGASPPESTRALIEAARERKGLTWTLADVAHRFDQIFAVPPEEIVASNTALRERARTWKHLVVRSPTGTALEIELSPRYEWVSIDGFEERAAGLVVNLPPGEIATYPAQISGTIRFVGALLGTIPIGRKHGLINAPLEIVIDDGAVGEVRGSGSLPDDVRFCLSVSEHAGLVCEVGLGTHPAIRSLEGLNYSYEEKHYGFHVGFGAALAQQNVERITDHHLDLLFADAVIEADGVVVFDGNSFVLT